jgi:alanine racemase
MLSPVPASATSDPVLSKGPPAEEACGILTIDLAAIEANYRMLSKTAVPAECAAVVKADGYGLGLEPVAARLRDAGCTTFFACAKR